VNANLPATGPDAEIVDDRLNWSESPIAIVASDEDMAFAETNDIEAAISCNIDKETKMPFETPTGIVTEVVQSEGRRAEVEASVVSRDQDSSVPKTNNISSAHIPNVGEIAYVFFDAPATCRVCEVGDDMLRGVGEGAIAVVERYPHATFTEPNDVASPVPCHICYKLDVFGGKPSSCILSKVPDNKGIDVVMPDNDSIKGAPGFESRGGWGGSPTG